MPNILTALDLHIEVLQGLQKVDSFQQDMFLPEEIDLQLNKQQDRFIEQLTNQKFQDRQVRLDYIKNLVVKNKKLPLYIPLTTDNNYEENMQFGVLPSDYLHIVSDRTEVTSRKSCKDIVYTPGQTVENLQVLKFPDPVIDPATSTYYLGLEISVDTTTDILYKSRFDEDPLDISQGSKITNPEEIGIIIKDILENINMGTYGENDRVYWEYYKGEYYPRSFIIITNGVQPQLKITAFDNTDTPLGSELGTLQSTPVLPTVRATVLSGISSPDTPVTRLIENKMSEADELYEFRKNVFYTPVKEEPHSTLSGDYLYLYREPSFILTDLTIDYIRKPRQISLLLDQGCELAGSAPRLIVDATIEYFKLVIENPSYQGILQDNQIRNQNTLTNG